MRTHLFTAMALFATTTVAIADDKPKPVKPATAVPTVAVPCAPEDSLLSAQNDNPVVCWPGGCMEIDPGQGTAKLVKKPAEQAAWLTPAEVRPEAGKLSTCKAGKCKPLGAKLVAAIEAARKEATPDNLVTLSGTTDLKAVVVNSDVWSVAADKLIKLKPPARKGEKPSVVGIEAAGDLLEVDWSACAGPCTEGQLADSAGNNIGKALNGGGPLMQLDAKRFVMMSEWADIYLFTMAGALKGTLKLGMDTPNTLQMVRLGEDIGVLRDTGNGLRFTKVSTFDNKLEAREEMFLPKCP